MHGDQHAAGAAPTRGNGARQVWALDRMVDKMEHPEWFDYCAPGAVLRGRDSTNVKVDRAFKDGEKLNWEGYEFTVDWMPGQTEFALLRAGDDRWKGAWLLPGQSVRRSARSLSRRGMRRWSRITVRSSRKAIFYGSEYLSLIKPRPAARAGHSYGHAGNRRRLSNANREWAYKMRDAFRELIAGEDYRYGFDPFLGAGRSRIDRACVPGRASRLRYTCAISYPARSPRPRRDPYAAGTGGGAAGLGGGSSERSRAGRSN